MNTDTGSGANPTAHRLARFAREFDEVFHTFLAPPDGVAPRLQKAIEYSALSPGKRIRPYLVVRCCEIAGGSREVAWPAAVAVECVHAFSLIHDDLPAMDDDDERRGQPTCHRKFDEATAILAGDALLALAFEIIADRVAPAAVSGAVAGELARGTGRMGMIGGQADDTATVASDRTANETRSIHNRKTAQLFRAACRIGAIMAVAPEPIVCTMGQYGENLGMAFQFADDLLDLNASDPESGVARTTEDARLARHFADSARQELATLGQRTGIPADAPDLQDLALFVVTRDF